MSLASSIFCECGVFRFWFIHNSKLTVIFTNNHNNNFPRSVQIGHILWKEEPLRPSDLWQRSGLWLRSSVAEGACECANVCEWACVHCAWAAGFRCLLVCVGRRWMVCMCVEDFVDIIPRVCICSLRSGCRCGDSGGGEAWKIVTSKVNGSE